MGNRSSAGGGGRRAAVDERYTRPQGLYVQTDYRDVDYRKLRRLILDSKLAPCYPGQDSSNSSSSSASVGGSGELEECPICFLYYPSLNRSQCCGKGICTECFLQMKPSRSARPSQCPFCKSTNYAVEYRGVKTKEEKGKEQIEEQRVIEAKIRMRQQEIRDEGERRKREMITPSDGAAPTSTPQAGHSSLGIAAQSRAQEVESDHGNYENDADISPQPAQSRAPENASSIRRGNLTMDLEEMMLMEAIWQSLQTDGTPPTAEHLAAGFPPAPSEQQSRPGESSASHRISMLQMLRSSAAAGASSTPSRRSENNNHRQIPESFEEQLMLALALSLDDA